MKKPITHPIQESSKDISFSFAMVGDISLNGAFSTDHHKNWERFDQIVPLFKSQSLVFANLEMPIETDERNDNKIHHHFANPIATKEVLQMLNISCVSLANNHIFDCKMSGLKETINLLDSNGIMHTGAGWLDAHVKPVTIENQGVKTGFLAYVDKSTNPKNEGFNNLKINYLEVDNVIAEVTALKCKVDIVVCSIHWGNDYSNFYTIKQQSLARRIIDAGADIIMGHHPHTIQPYEVYNGKHILFSLGGICFGDFYRNGKLAAIKRKTKLGMIAITNRDATKFSFVPTKDLPGNRVIFPKLNLNRKLNWLGRVNKASNRYGFINSLVTIKEAFIDRIFEYFFGYYRNPLLQLFEFRSIKKLGFMIRDYKKVKQ